MRYRLRTLLIVLALGPPVLALSWLHPVLGIWLVFAVVIFCGDRSGRTDPPTLFDP
jgi:hypothetical protein